MQSWSYIKWMLSHTHRPWYLWFICQHYSNSYVEVYIDEYILYNIFNVYFGCDFSDCCPHLYCGKLKGNISAAVSSSFPKVSLVYLGIDMIQDRKSFLKFDCWSNKVFKDYEDFIQIMTLLFFMPINPRSIMRSFMRWIWIGIGSNFFFFQETAVPKCNPAWSIDSDLVLTIWKDSDNFA